MGGSYLDTTILIHLVGDDNSDSLKKFVDDRSPATHPAYALREALAGYVQTLCQLHNKMLAADHLYEVVAAIANMNPAQGRKVGLSLKEFGLALEARTKVDTTISQSELLVASRRDLALKIYRIWGRARRLPQSRMIQQLACFSVAELDVGEGGEFRGVKGSFNCDKRDRCAAAAYLSDNPAELSKLIDALHPDKLQAADASKSETVSRRKALKELVREGPLKFNKRYCRAIGDAYFAIMCPMQNSLLTTNVSDFPLLCEALGKKVESPKS